MSDFLLPTETLQVQPGASLPTQVPAFGAQIGNALTQLGQVQTHIYRDHNAVAAMAAQNELNEWTTEALYHPQNGALHQEAGLNAPKVVDKTLSDYEAKRSKIAAALPNDDARASFNMAADEHANSVRKQLYGYEHAQVTHAANETTAAYVENLRNSAVQHLMVQGPPSDAQTQEGQQAILDDIAKQKAAIADACRRNGDSAEVCTEQQTRVASATHMAVLGTLLDQGQDMTAKAWLDNHRGELTAEDLQRAEAKTQIGSTAGEAQRWTDTHVLTDKGEPQTRGALEQQIRNDPRLQQDVKLRDQVQSRVDQFLEHHQQAVAESQKATFDQAAEMLQDDKNPTTILDPKIQQMRLQMSPEHWARLETMSKREAPQVDPVAVYRFQQALADPTTRDEWARKDLTKEFDPRTPQFEKLAGMQAEAIKGGGPKMDSFLTREQAVKRAYALAQIAPKDENSPQGIALSDALEQRVKANEAAGKKMSGDDINELAKQMLVEDVVYKSGTLYGTNAVAPYTLTADDIKDTILPDDKLRAANPALADQFNANIKTRAVALGLSPDRIPQPAYDTVRALTMIARDEEAAGRKGQERHRQALAAIDETLRAAHQAAPKPGEEAPGTLHAPEFGGYN